MWGGGGAVTGSALADMLSGVNINEDASGKRLGYNQRVQDWFTAKAEAKLTGGVTPGRQISCL